jgi:Holliday junction resolvase RusA-like endonuclease
VFHVEMPKSWSKAKRARMKGRPHQSKPDSDNMTKALFDALSKEDQSVWDYHVTKIWDEEGYIEVIMGEPCLN